MTSFSGGPTKTEARGKPLLPDLVAQEPIPALFCEVKGQDRPSGDGHYMELGEGQRTHQSMLQPLPIRHDLQSSARVTCTLRRATEAHTEHVG